MAETVRFRAYAVNRLQPKSSKLNFCHRMGSVFSGRGGPSFRHWWVLTRIFGLGRFLGSTHKASWVASHNRPLICNLKKNRIVGEKIRLIFGLAELSRKLKIRLRFGWLQKFKIRLITNNLGWAVEPKLKWLPTWMMYLLLLSVSLMLQNLHPSVITRSFEIMRIIHFK